jgi:hypothetical protein
MQTHDAHVEMNVECDSGDQNVLFALAQVPPSLWPPSTQFATILLFPPKCLYRATGFCATDEARRRFARPTPSVSRFYPPLFDPISVYARVDMKRKDNMGLHTRKLGDGGYEHLLPRRSGT